MIKHVHIVNHTHTDLGYTNLPHKVALGHVRHLDDAIDLCRRSARKPEGLRFTWTIEALWALREFTMHAPPSRMKALLELVKSGRIELTGFLHQPLTQLMSLPDLIEELSYGAEFASAHGIRLDTLMLDDMGGVTWNIPQVMTRLGFKYFILGGGAWRVMTPVAGLPHIFRYIGPDGGSALVYHLGLGRDLDVSKAGPLHAQYGFGVVYLLLPFHGIDLGDDGKVIPCEKWDAPLYGLVRRLEKEGYAYDTLLLQCGSDNDGPQADILKVVEKWNRSHDDITLRLGTASEFFRCIEMKYADSIPSLSGELTCSWSEHVLTQGRGCGLVKEAERNLYAADVLATRHQGDCEALRHHNAIRGEIVSNALLFKDHTFGISMWGWEASQRNSGRLHMNGSCHEHCRSSWETKHDYAHTAWTLSRNLGNDEENLVALEGRRVDNAMSLVALVEGRRVDSTVAFFNPLPFARSGLARFFARDLGDISLTLGHEVVRPDRELMNGTYSEYSVWLPRLEACSFLTCACQPAPAGPCGNDTGIPFTVRETPTLLHAASPHVSLSIDKKTGGIVSWKASGVELVDKTAGGGLNGFALFSVQGVSEKAEHLGLHEKPVFEKQSIRKADVAVTHVGRHVLKIQLTRIVGETDRLVRIESEIAITAGDNRLHLRNKVRKINLPEKEAGYFMFPFNVGKDWRLLTHQQGYLHDFVNERLPGSAHQNIGFQDFVILSDKRKGVVLTSLHATVLSVGEKPKYYSQEINYRKDLKGWLHLYCFNNLFNTNCAVEQTGDMNFDFILTPLTGKELTGDPAVLHRKSKEACFPIAGLANVDAEASRPTVSIDNPAIDCEFLAAADESSPPRLLLTNLSRKAQRARIALDGEKARAKTISFKPAEFKVIVEKDL